MNIYEQFKNICKESEKYPTRTDLIYKYGIKRQDILNIQKLKFEDKEYIKIPLFSESGNKLIYWNNQDIIMTFSDCQDLIRNSSLNDIADFSNSDMINGFIFSEIESSLSIEGVRSTRAKIEKINQLNYDELDDMNDIIVKNMLLGYEFIKNKDITEENIFELYKILSNKCLKDHEQLPPNYKYRHDDVHIVDNVQAIVDRGVYWKKLQDSMGQMINYINKEKSYSEHLIASHIIHFYLIYLHPYFDYNGRMARVLSYWYNQRYAPSLSLLLVSEAINNKVHKNGYYTAIANSRKEDNDITYFLEYIADIMLEYTKVYINFNNITKKLKGDGNILNRSTEIALKYVLALPVIGEGYFDWKEYNRFSHDDFSKTQYLKLLNTLAEADVLLVKEKKKAKLFKLNKDKWNLI